LCVIGVRADFLRGAESILLEKSGAIWQFFGPKNCQIARKKIILPDPGGVAAPPLPAPGSYAFVVCYEIPYPKISDYASE